MTDARQESNRNEDFIANAMSAFGDSVYRLALAYTKQTNDAEDIYQAVFIKLFVSSHSFVSSEHLKAWLIRVTINQCKDCLKSSRRSKETSFDDLIYEPESPSAASVYDAKELWNTTIQDERNVESPPTKDAEPVITSDEGWRDSRETDNTLSSTGAINTQESTSFSEGNTLIDVNENEANGLEDTNETSTDLERTDPSSNTIAYMSIKNLIAESSLIVEGIVISKSEPFLIKPVDGGDPHFHTDIYVSIQNLFRKTTEKAGDEIVIRFCGNTANTSEVSSSTDLNSSISEGESYLFFLYQYPAGGGCRTAESRYYATGLSQGIYLSQPNGTYIELYGSRVIGLDFPQTTAVINATNPPDINYYVTLDKKRLEEQLLNGEITNEEYVKYTNQITQFATIVSR